MIMSFDEISNTSLGLGLGLGLGLHEHYHQAENCMKKKEENYYDPSKCNINKAYPILSLTLGPKIIDDDQQQEASKIELASSNNYSPSAVSNSFSNSSSIIMKEKDQFLGEEFEVDEKIPSSRSRDVDDIIIEDGNPRKKLRLSKEQSTILEENFKEHSTLNPKQKQELAKKLNLRARQVEVWFQNRRARTKLKQTESECELLRKCCETLTEENKRLQKELQQLRSTQTTTTAVPFYMHIPSAATLTICPSCEGKLICGDANNNIINYNNASSSSSPKNTTSTTFLIAASSNPHTHNHNHNHFYKNNNYPFSHSSSSSMLAS